MMPYLQKMSIEEGTNSGPEAGSLGLATVSPLNLVTFILIVFLPSLLFMEGTLIFHLWQQCEVSLKKSHMRMNLNRNIK